MNQGTAEAIFANLLGAKVTFDTPADLNGASLPANAFKLKQDFDERRGEQVTEWLAALLRYEPPNRTTFSNQFGSLRLDGP